MDRLWRLARQADTPRESCERAVRAQVLRMFNKTGVFRSRHVSHAQARELRASIESFELRGRKSVHALTGIIRKKSHPTHGDHVARRPVAARHTGATEAVDVRAVDIIARSDAASLKAGAGKAPSPLQPWLQRAGTTWDRVRKHILHGLSMVRPERLLVTAQLAHRSIAVDGDFVETGTAKGGSSILMMAVLDDAGAAAAGKRHFACDSFQGLPTGTVQDYSGFNNCSVAERSITGAHSCGYRGLVKLEELLRSFRGAYRTSRRQFEANVRASGVGMSRMVVVEGWFNTSLPPKDLQRISFLRLDGDLYQSTHDALVALYPLVSPGGAIYVDDYGSYGGCKLATDQYRERHAITTPMVKVWQDLSSAKRVASRFNTRHEAAGFSFEAVWWIKE